MMNVRLVTTILLVLSSASAAVGKSKHGYETTFFDSFYGRPGSSISTSNWIFDIGTSYPGGPAKWGNGEFESYTNSTANVAITKHNTLTITPRLSKAGNWTSGRIETKRSDFSCKKGGKLYVEAKIKLGRLPASKQLGIWPAFWALGSAFRGNYSNWPLVSEWDILEVLNGAPTMYTTIHCGTAPGGPCNEYNGIGNHTNFTLGVWHTVGFEVDRSVDSGNEGNATIWMQETLSWYLDGKLVFLVTGAMINNLTAWTPLAHDDHFLLLNVAVGGGYPSALAGVSTPTNATVGGREVAMEVDYVGVWNSR